MNNFTLVTKKVALAVRQEATGTSCLNLLQLLCMLANSSHICTAVHTGDNSKTYQLILHWNCCDRRTRFVV